MFDFKQNSSLHQPILVQELLSLFSVENPPQKILDCSFGRGGHSLAFVRQFSQARVTALDCDHQAVEYGQTLKEVKEGKIKLLRKNFHHFPRSLKGKKTYDLILMDLGVSSPQLDTKERGFSFYQEGPLDMRMDKRGKIKAEDIINTWSKKELVQLFQSYGEIKKPHKITDLIVQKRKRKKFKTTTELSDLIKKHSFYRGKHPATAWFLALRIRVNNELEGLEKCLPDFLPLLREQGYLAVLSFHSLEDRVVKKAFRQWTTKGTGRLWNKKVIRPSLEEKKTNPRSRSAKLRVFQKGTCLF